MAPRGTPAKIFAGADVQPSAVVIWRFDRKKLFIQANDEQRLSSLLPVLTGGRLATPDRMTSVGQKREC